LAQRIAAVMDDGAHLLLHTISSGHLVFSEPYHTVRAGNRFVRELLTAPVSAAKPMAREHQVDLVLLCREPGWMYLKAQSAMNICHLDNENSLVGDILSGRTPDWLQEISVPDSSGYRLFKTAFR
jgi:hypothetical protein